MCWFPLDDVTTCTAYARLLSQTPSCLFALVEFSSTALGTVGRGVQWGLSAGITVYQRGYNEAADALITFGGKADYQAGMMLQG